MVMCQGGNCNITYMSTSNKNLIAVIKYYYKKSSTNINMAT